MSLANTAVGSLDYIEVLFGIIIAWILIALWQRALENTIYGKIGLNPQSAYHAFIVALIVTLIFLVLITSVDSISRGILTGATTSKHILNVPVAPSALPTSDAVQTNPVSVQPTSLLTLKLSRNSDGKLIRNSRRSRFEARNLHRSRTNSHRFSSTG